eukprot:3931645-Rhodomonas_salina.2
MLGSASKLSYSQLRWSASDFKNFGGALNQFAGNLETLGLSRAGLDDAGLEGWCAALQMYDDNNIDIDVRYAAVIMCGTDVLYAAMRCAVPGRGHAKANEPQARLEPVHRLRS